jgi:osmoprotectant transport system permease protein
MRSANPVLALLVGVAAAAALGLGFVAQAPNRLLSGAPVPLWTVLADAPMPWLALFLGTAAVLVSGVFLRPAASAQGALAVAASLWLATLLVLAGEHAQRLATPDAPLARTSFGAGFWVMALAGAMALADALQRLRWRRTAQVLAAALALLPVLALLASGRLDELSLLKEYANRREEFHQALWQHLRIVVAALAPTVLLGGPLGVWAFGHPRFARPLLALLGVLQTVPAIALFGLLIAPLSALGLPGVGLLPAAIALFVYSLLPIVRGIHTGLEQVGEPVVEAATAMGMTARQLFWQVRVPIALPLLLTGLRVCTVQAIGLAMLAALIGAGGLGSIMFQGLFGTALDLVLLGVLPAVALALFVDALFRVAVAASRVRTA